MKRNKITYLIFLLVIAVSACTSGRGILTSSGPPPCGSALECARLDTVEDELCTFEGSQRSRKLWTLKNKSPDKTVYVTLLLTVIEVDAPSPERQEYLPRALKPGHEVTLHCYLERRQNSPGGLYEWSYSIVSACFEGECPSPLPSTPARLRPPKITCEELCASSNESCFKAEILKTEQSTNYLRSNLSQFVNSIAGKPLPLVVNMKPLYDISNLFTGQQKCWRDSLNISSKNSTGLSTFANNGGSCEVAFELVNPAGVVLDIVLPSEWRGEAAVAQDGFRLKSMGFVNSPIMTVAKSNNAVEVDPISSISGIDGLLTFAGENYYCAQVRWDKYRGFDGFIKDQKSPNKNK